MPASQLLVTRKHFARPLSKRAAISPRCCHLVGFLSALTDNEQLIRHIADVTVLLEQVRDLSLDVDSTLQKASQDGAFSEESQHALAQLNTHIITCNQSIVHIVAELSQRLSTDPTVLSQEAQQTISRLRLRQGTPHHRRAKNS